MKSRTLTRASLFTALILSAILFSLLGASAQIGQVTSTAGGVTGQVTGAVTKKLKTPADLPKFIDVRGPHGVPRGLTSKLPTEVQQEALAALGATLGGAKLQVQYNGLTATPRHIYSHGTYLSAPSTAPAEQVARDFISRWRAVFRFNQRDVDSLRLKSRTTLADLGTTVLLFEQTRDGLPVYKGEVLVNVSRTGQVISVGGDSFPQMTVADGFVLPEAQAVTAAAAALGVAGFVPQAKGTKKVLTTFGDLPHEFTTGKRFAGGVFTDDIVVTKTIFPVGAAGRPAYTFTLTTPQYAGMMWLHVVDAQTGAVLRRNSLTAFQQGGGPSNSRRSTFRPDIQDSVESIPTAGGAGKVFDGQPTALSGPDGYGRSPARGVQPAYAPEGTTTAPGRAFRRSWVFARHAAPFADPGTPLFSQVYNTPFGQVLRGLPNALNPSTGSPFGWFYLPTANGGAEITADNSDRAATRAYGYSMHPEAQARNEDSNSPTGDGNQPFSASVTPLGSSVILGDGRQLNSVIESNYTEGNNTVVAEDHAGDNETTHGVKGYGPNRQFTAPYFDYTASYEYGNMDAGGCPVDAELLGQCQASQPFFPPSTFPDVYPGTTTLFYYTNLMHDYLYGLGFTEPTWNFQQDNFGKGGAGRDGVSAQVQDGSGTDNANFSTPNDGSNPRMQMYLFTETGQRRSDGDLDFDIVAHEYYHGVSNRSVGKGTSDCLGNPLVGESGGMGEGWSDYIAVSMAEDDATGEFATGNFISGIRKMPYTNYRYSYGTIQGTPRRRDQQPPGTGEQIFLPYETHEVGQVWTPILWDMRELMVVKQSPSAIFFDGTRRLGAGTAFFIGMRQVQSVDAQHPINYRSSFNTGSVNTINPAAHVVRPGAIAAEIQALGHRNGPLASALRDGARLADTIVLRGMQLAPCNPSFVEMRDAMLAADRELTGGENLAIIWRAFASHGVGVLAASTSGAADDPGSQVAPAVVEDFSVPATVTDCEQFGPHAPPSFSLSNPAPNTARITITAPSPGASLTARYIISRGDSADGPFVKIADIPVTQTTYDDAGLPGNRTYFYQVRTARNSECVGSPNTGSVFVAGDEVTPSPLFAGVDRVDDPRDGSRLIVSWGPAVSLNPTANIVYDVHRVSHVNHGTMQNDPTFTPDESNKIATVTGTSYVDTGLELAQVYYYIVRARDTTNGKVDTNDVGNVQTRYNAPTIPQLSAPTFALETFESSSADTRFAPPLADSGNNPNQALAAFQRITVPNLGMPSAGKMYAPDFSPGDEEGLPDPAGTHHGGQSDFYTQIGPFNGPNNPALTSTSIMEFDNAINAEARFDGGNIEVKVGAPFASGDATPFPDNVVTFDLGDYIIEGGYNGKLDGSLPACVPPAPCRGSALQGRRAYTGIKPLHHVRAVLHNFAPGGLHNPQGLPVYIRFRMTSDVASANGLDSGWFVDNLAINNLACRVNVASSEAGATAEASSTYSSRNYTPAGAIDGDRRGFDWENGGGWNDATRDVWPDWLQVNFSGSQTVHEVRVYTLQNDFRNAQEPTPETRADLYGIRDFEVQYWNGSAWVTVPNGVVTGNDRAMRVISFPDITTSRIRVNVTGGREHFSRIVEVEAFGGCPTQ